LRPLDITVVHGIEHVIACWLTFSELCGNQIIYNQPVTYFGIPQTGYSNILCMYLYFQRYISWFFVLFNDFRWWV